MRSGLRAAAARVSKPRTPSRLFGRANRPGRIGQTLAADGRGCQILAVAGYKG